METNILEFLEKDLVKIEKKMSKAIDEDNFGTYKNLLDATDRILKMLNQYGNEYKQMWSKYRDENGIQHVSVWKQNKDNDIKEHFDFTVNNNKSNNGYIEKVFDKYLYKKENLESKTNIEIPVCETMRGVGKTYWLVKQAIKNNFNNNVAILTTYKQNIIDKIVEIENTEWYKRINGNNKVKVDIVTNLNDLHGSKIDILYVDEGFENVDIPNSISKYIRLKLIKEQLENNIPRGMRVKTSPIDDDCNIKLPNMCSKEEFIKNIQDYNKEQPKNNLVYAECFYSGKAETLRYSLKHFYKDGVQEYYTDNINDFINIIKSYFTHNKADIVVDARGMGMSLCDKLTEENIQYKKIFAKNLIK